MEFRVRILPEASDDAQKLYWRVSSQAPFYVQEWYNGLFAAIDSLRFNPTRCALARDPRYRLAGVRQLLYGRKPHSYRILFRVRPDEQMVEILKIRPGSMRHLS